MMKRSTPWAAAIAVAVFLLASGQASAQTKKELAAKVVQLRQPAIDGLALNIAADPAQRAMQAAGQILPLVPEDKREALAKQVQADVKAFYDDISAKIRESGTRQAAATWQPMLEEKLTEDELKLVITWLESSAARKYEQIEPDMQKALARKIVEDTKSYVEPKVASLQETLRKRFAPYVPSGASAPAGKPTPPASAPKAPPKKQ